MASENTPDTVASGSPDAMHARADGSGNINQVRIVLPVSAWAVAVLSALAIVASGLALYEVGQVRMHEQVNAYDLNNLQTGKIAWLVGEVQNNHDLIQNYGIGKTCRRSK